MTQVNSFSTIHNLEWTDKILPQNTDKTWKVVAKFALVIMTLGSIFLVTLTRDLSKNAFMWLITKKPAEPKPPTTGEKIKEGSLATLNGLLTFALYSTRLCALIPIFKISQTPNSLAKWSFSLAYTGATAAFWGYLERPNLAYAAIATHAIVYSIQPLASYYWSAKKNS
ncbi:MAG: hypothetical protein K940chlam1_00906 [Candidatus Anoxychlamydiales bacterium]|nr:hypothetical protein [Candidatus Anoxychlamydiales bacterium]NGX36535.1 hypothetical protein [Candidatus Anoxychlamydiales bacterium]